MQVHFDTINFDVWNGRKRTLIREEKSEDKLIRKNFNLILNVTWSETSFLPDKGPDVVFWTKYLTVPEKLSQTTHFTTEPTFFKYKL